MKDGGCADDTAAAVAGDMRVGEGEGLSHTSAYLDWCRFISPLCILKHSVI